MPEDVFFGNALGGVNYAVPPSKLSQFELAHAQNIVSNRIGYATKRGGASKLNTTAYGSLVTSFHEFINGGTSYKFAAQGEKVGLYNSTTRAFADHITGLTSGAYGQWLNYGDYAIYVNGYDNPQKSDGTTGDDLTADLSGLTAGRCIAEWGERVWISQGAQLYGSALRAPTDFSTTTTDIGFWDGYIGNKKQDITGLFAFFDVLLIGKQNQIYLLAGAPETKSSTFRLTPLFTKDKDSIGFSAKDAIAQVGNELLFLDGFDIKRMSGVQQYGDVESISIVGNVRDFLKSSAGAGLDKDYLKYSHFFHYKHKEQIWCAIPTGASTVYWFVLDYSNPSLRSEFGLPKFSFFPMSGFTPVSFGGVENGSRVDLYAGCSDGYVRQLDTGTNDDTTAIDSFVVFGFGHPSRRIQPMHIGLSVNYSTACTLSLAHAFGLQDWRTIKTAGNYTSLSDEDLTHSSWKHDDSSSDVFKRISSIIKSGKSFMFKIRHNTAGQTFNLGDCYLKPNLKQRY